MYIRTHKLLAMFFLFILISCEKEVKKLALKKKETVVKVSNSKNDLSILLDSVMIAHGSWQDLLNKKDVRYHYEYRVPGNKADISTERYIFSTEASFGHYMQHDINALPQFNGIITQFFDGKQSTASVNNNKLEGSKLPKDVEFLRRANYFWFVMPYKLKDKGTIAKSLGQEEYKGIKYHKIEITYDPLITGKKLNDIYILFINPKTKMIDRFYFSLPFFGVTAPIIIANYNYKNIEGQQIATDRTYFFPNKKGVYETKPNVTQTLTQVKFNNGFDNNNIQIIKH